ncbi:MAG: hypothetical protein KA229_11010 [Chitinophagaceae bacterium]|nr:hypothetical protein [Chitinophagaceae bacterium]MBP6590626.1 hypothetical protein [Chitinophagaceae bacterium]
MSIYLLDGVGAGFLLLLFGLGVLFIFIAILAEAMVMQLMKYEPVFKKAMLRSFVVNLISLAAGFILTSSSSSLFHLENMAGFALMFAVTLLIETIGLYLMYREKPVTKTLLVSLVMNVVTYLLAYILIIGIYS